MGLSQSICGLIVHRQSTANMWPNSSKVRFYLSIRHIRLGSTNHPGCWNLVLAAAVTALVMQLDRVIQTFHEPPVVDRFAQEADRSVIERTSPVFFVWVRGNQDHRHLISPRPQFSLQLKPVLSGHLQVSDQACRPCDHRRLEETFCRCESGGSVS